MPRMIDQIRASKLPSNMMQFAARGALQVPAAENVEILVHLALHNKVFGDLARMTLAGWDEKSCVAAVSDPQTPREVLVYFISPDNLRPKLLPGLLENPSVPEGELVKLAISALRETIEFMLRSPRIGSLQRVLETLRTNPYVKKEEAEELGRRLNAGPTSAANSRAAAPASTQASPALQRDAKLEDAPSAGETATVLAEAANEEAANQAADQAPDPTASQPDDETVTAYMNEHGAEIAAEGNKPFQAIGGIVELLGADYFPVTQTESVPTVEPASVTSALTPVPVAAQPGPVAQKKAPAQGGPPQRQNTLQKINALDVKGRIQLALKGNKEERSILIRDGTKVVALAVLEAPKLADGEVEKFASQKNVLEAVLRQIPLKRRFVKNYNVVRNLVANPRTPLDLGLGLMKNIMAQDLKNISANKEVSETIRKLALKMYKQKVEDANKKK